MRDAVSAEYAGGLKVHAAMLDNTTFGTVYNHIFKRED